MDAINKMWNKRVDPSAISMVVVGMNKNAA